MTNSRREFFKQLIGRKDKPLRPPWALPEPEFIRTCTHCNKCIDNCPEHIIQIGSGNYPEVNLANGGCTFCGNCIDNCGDAALIKQNNDNPWGLVTIKKTCLSLQGITCRTCSDFCDEQAIQFKLETGGKATPTINREKCTGCGACLSPCPTAALAFEHDTKGVELCQS